MAKQTQSFAARSFLGADYRRAAVIASLGLHGSQSRADLARRLEVSPTLITQVVKKLLDEGLIQELNSAENTQMGRPSVQLGLKSVNYTAVGLKVASDHISCVESTLSGEVRKSTEIPLNASSLEVAEIIARELKKFMGSGYENRVLGVGVGVPGTVDALEIGEVNSTLLGWDTMPLGKLLRNELRLPVIVENNVNALAVAEYLFGVGDVYDSLLVVTLGTGVGSGYCNEGTVLHGMRGAAGNLGHVIVKPGGEKCHCGNSGCLETLIGESALITAARSRGLIKEDQKIEALIDLANSGNEDAAKIFSRGAEHLGRSIAAVVNVLAPEVIVIQGEGTQAWKYWDSVFKHTLRSSIIKELRDIDVVIRQWRDDKWALGAASLVLMTPFEVDGSMGEQGELIRQRILSSKNE